MKTDVTPFFDERTCTVTYVVVDPRNKKATIPPYFVSIHDEEPICTRRKTNGAQESNTRARRHCVGPRR